MKDNFIRHLGVIFVICLIFGCGGSDESQKIEGPILSMGEATSLVVDQFYVNGGMDDEYGAQGEFSVYLRDASTGIDVACAQAVDGMDKLSTPGIYYGGLSIPLMEVLDDHPTALAKFQVVFVEQDGDGCPKPISDEDDVAGSSAEFTFDGLLDQQIWATNGRAAVVFRQSNKEVLHVRAMAPSLEEGLEIDSIYYFNNGEDGQKASGYYLFADRVEDGQSLFQCQVDGALMSSVKYGGIVYAALGFPVPCFDGTDPEFATTKVRLSLYIQLSSGPALVGETEPTAIGELIGERAEFTNNSGYITFRGVMDVPFSSPVVRLAELTALSVAALEYELTPSYNPTIELQFTDVQGGYVIACAGGEQGLSGVGSPGSYSGLDATFMAADGQKELFGWSRVVLRLVDRDDGLVCPAPLGTGATVLATTDDLASTALGAGDYLFENGAGEVSLTIR